MDKNPVIYVLKTLKTHRVRFLLMGGQACILYGASEFTRDSDICILCNERNLDKLKNAFKDLQAQQAFFPPLTKKFLEKGHACHFVCGASAAIGFRVDIMSRMRGCPDFHELWKSRSMINVPGLRVPVLSLPQLVQAKKTQRDKDWPMIRRLIETDIASSRKPDHEKVQWWLQECRTPELLISLAKKYPRIAKIESQKRGLLLYAINGKTNKLETSLHIEEIKERRQDAKYWTPLRLELERLRHEKKRHSQGKKR